MCTVSFVLTLNGFPYMSAFQVKWNKVFMVFILVVVDLKDFHGLFHFTSCLHNFFMQYLPCKGRVILAVVKGFRACWGDSCTERSLYVMSLIKVAVTKLPMMSRKGILPVLSVHSFCLLWFLLLTAYLHCGVKHTQSVCKIFNSLLAPQSIMRLQSSL